MSLRELSQQKMTDAQVFTILSDTKDLLVRKLSVENKTDLKVALERIQKLIGEK